MKDKAKHSKFWLDGEFSVTDANQDLDLIKLAAYRRAVSNFVYILTGKNIPVKFTEKLTSLTDGKVIYIGGELSKGEVDSTVGLSLHEAMHIVESDFTALKNLWQKIPTRIYTLTDGKFAKSFVADFVKYMLNVVEDRYIDAYACATAPGYKGYYDALYDKYFNTPKINKALKSDALRKCTLFAYKFRVVNLVNKNSDLDALPDLRKISEMLAVNSVLKLETFMDRFETAIDVCEIIFQNVISKLEDDGKKKEETKSEDKSESSGEKENNSGENDSPKNDQPLETPTDNEQPTNDEDAEYPNEESSDDKDAKAEADLKSTVERQDEFINRQIKQKSINAESLRALEELEKNGVEIKTVGIGLHRQVECIIVKKMTPELVESDGFPYSRINKYPISALADNHGDSVREGMIVGTMLGAKLQVRGEVTTVKYSKQIQGKFDRRMVYGLGFDKEDVFYRMTTDIYKNAHVHVSVDASSSMEANWKITMKTLVAIAKAASTISNLGVTISFRSGVERNNGEKPYVVIAYDSRVDKLSKINNLFSKIFPSGTTPEGLAFEAILDMIEPSTPMLDSYFINISDGEPYFQHGGYSGEIATLHTRKQINSIRKMGVHVTSYFIGTENRPMFTIGSRFSNKDVFTQMYGNDSHFINLENMMEIANTLNKKFLQKK